MKIVVFHDENITNRDLTHHGLHGKVTNNGNFGDSNGAGGIYIHNLDISRWIFWAAELMFKTWLEQN